MHPPQPGGYPPMPQHPAQVEVGPSPSGGTAITAAVLSILGALAGLVQAIRGFQLTSLLPAIGLTDGIGGVLSLGLLGAGAATVFMRKPIARWLIVAGCAVVVVMTAVSLVAGGTIAQRSIDRVEGSGPAGSVFITTLVVVGILLLIPAIATGILALVPLTKRYLEWRGAQPWPPEQQWQPQQQWQQQQPGQQQSGPQQPPQQQPGQQQPGQQQPPQQQPGQQQWPPPGQW